MAAAAVVLLVLAAIWGRGHGPGGDDQPVYHNRVATVTRVVDSLRFEIDLPDRERERTRVRFCGLLAHDGGDEAIASAGLEVGARVRLLLPPSPTRDADGWLLAYVVLEDNNEKLNERLLAEGKARADRRQDHPLKSKFAAVERRARQRGAGQWSGLQEHAAVTP